MKIGTISVVAPVFNEKDSLVPFYQQLHLSLHKVTKSYEILFVDDGSSDTSLAILQELAKKDKNIRIFSFRKNEGKAEALTLGFQKAIGDIIITLDADLQDQPSEIALLLDKMSEGWDVVSGWRKQRKDSFPKILSSKLFNLLARVFWGLQLHDYNCGLKVYTRDAAKSLYLYGGFHRFIPMLVYQNGFSVTEVPVKHEKRKFGKSKFGFSKLWRDLPDIFTMLFLVRYSKRPLHFFGTVGGAMLIIGFLLFDYLSFVHFFYNQTIGRRPLFFFSILLMLAGLQVFFTGFIAELITSLNHKGSLHYPLKYSSE